MATLNDRVYDNGLGILATEGTRIDICSAEPATYTAATSTNSLGNKTAITISAPAAKAGGGREVTISAVSGGSVTATGTAAYWAISDPTNSRLLATGALSASQSVTSGNTFSLASFKIGIPGPV